MSDELYKMLKQRLTRKELEKLESLVSDYGNLEDVVLTAVRKLLDPDFITFTDMEMCLQKALKLSAYVSTLNQNSPATSDVSVASQVAREVAQSVNDVEHQPQQNNPLAEMLMALKQQIEQQIIEEIKSKFSLPVKNTNTANGSNGSVKGYPTNSDDIFKGDE